MSRFRQKILSGFVISKNKGPEQTSYLRLYTKQEGLISVRINLGTKLTHRFQGKVEILSKADFSIYETSNNNYRITNITNVINQHLDNLSHTKHKLIMQISNLSRLLIPESQPIHNLYRIFEQTHTALTKDENQETILIHFLSQLLTKLGTLPNLKNCQTCNNQLGEVSHYNQVTPELYCTSCNPLKETINLNHRKLLHYARNLDFPHFSQIQTPTEDKLQSLVYLSHLISGYLNKDIKLTN